MHITPGGNGGGLARNRHFHLPVNHIERFIPRMKVRGWPAALHAFLDMHFKRFTQIPTRKNGDGLTHDIDRVGFFSGLDDMNRSHDCSPKDEATPAEYIHLIWRRGRATSPSVRAISTPMEFSSGGVALLM
jgi:hypothetical protein